MSHLEGVFVLEAVGHELALAHVIQPVHLPSGVLAAVEGSEPIVTKYIIAYLMTMPSSLTL